MLRNAALVVSLAWIWIAAGPAGAQTRAIFNASRTSGPAPLAVFFDATTSSCAGCGDAYHELHYRWNFDDAGSGDWPVSGKPRNEAFGPMSAHVFDQPGQYDVTLTVTDGAGATHTRSMRIDVSDPDTYWSGAKTECFSTSGNFSGCPAGATRTVTSSLTSAWSSCAKGPNRCLFRGGEVFDTSGTLQISTAGPGLVASYGPGRAIFNQTANAFLFQHNSSGPGWRLTDFEARSNATVGSTRTGLVASGGGSIPVSELLVKDTRIAPASFHAVVSYPNGNLPIGPLHSDLFFVDNDWQDIGLHASGTGGNGFFMVAERVAVMGNVVRDTNSAPGYGEHILRCKHCNDIVIEHNHLGEPAGGKAVLTLRAANLVQCSGGHAGCGTPSRHLLVSDNRFGLTELNQVSFVGVSAGGRGLVVAMEDIIFERNYFTQGAFQNPVGLRSGLYMHDGDSNPGSYVDGVTIRDNIFNLSGWTNLQHAMLQGGNITNARIYNNTCYSSDWASASKTVKCAKGPPSGSTVAYNNLLYAPAVPAAQKEVCNAGMDCRNNLDLSVNPFVAANPNNPADFQLKPGSAPVNAGTSVGADGVDFNLGARPSGGQVDVGAMEQGAAGVPPPPGPGGPPAAPVLLP